MQTGAITYNSGFAIEGLSVLATKNNSWTPLYVIDHGNRMELTEKCSVNELISSVVPYSVWTHTTDGVNIEGTKDVIFVDLAERTGLSAQVLQLRMIRTQCGPKVTTYKVMSFLWR